MRAGYDMAEVDAFLDTIEASVTAYASELQDTRDESDALRSQVQQLQARLAGLQAELDECRALGTTAPASDAHDTIVTVVSDEADSETTAETPIVTGIDPMSTLRKVRDDVRRMLTDQLQLVDDLEVESR